VPTPPPEPHPPSGEPAGTHGDTPFAVRLVHRVRFTRSCLDPRNPTLASVFEPGPGGRAPRAVAFLDDGVARAHPALAAALASYGRTTGAFDLVEEPHVVPGGEAAKNSRDVVERVLASVDRGRICRRSYVIAVGGGAVLDAVGFAAATAHRGVRLVRLPTTTLAQGDSCVAVKCGINLFGKKNWLGAFAAPWGVVNDLDLLDSLGERDWRSGFSEAVKVALVKDGRLFERLERDAQSIARREPGPSEAAILASAELHLRHITDGQDPFELTEARPLDFGHWAAHKLEQMTQNRLRHGEAVAIGVAIDTVYSALCAHLSEGEAERVLACLARLGFAMNDPALERTDELLGGLEEFREHLGGRLTISLLGGLGVGFDAHEIDRRVMVRAIERVRGWRAP
jgi:3-dehydroquinate synthase